MSFYHNVKKKLRAKRTKQNVAFGLILFWILTLGLVFSLILVSNNLDKEQGSSNDQQSSRNTSHCEIAFLEKNHRRVFLSIIFFLECLNSEQNH